MFCDITEEIAGRVIQMAGLFDSVSHFVLSACYSVGLFYSVGSVICDWPCYSVSRVIRLAVLFGWQSFSVGHFIRWAVLFGSLCSSAASFVRLTVLYS